MSAGSAAIAENVSRLRRRTDAVRRIRDLLRLELREGGDTNRVLPDERILAKQLGASRNAVREALSLLRDEGLIERRQGAGTLVRAIPAPFAGDGRQGMINRLEDGARRVRYDLLASESVPATATMAQLLGMETGEQMAVLERLTHIDGAPVVVWTNHLRLADGAKVAALELGCDGIELIERALSTRIGKMEMRMEAVLADESVAELLDVACGRPLMRLERRLFDDSGRIVTVGFGRLRSDLIGMVIVADRHISAG